MSLRSQILLLFALCAGLYQANGRPHPVVDTHAAPYVAWCLLQDGSNDLSRFTDIAGKYPEQVHSTGDGRIVAIRPIGDALFVVPVLAPVALFRHDPPGDSTMNFAGKLAGSLSGLGAALFFFLTCCRLFPNAAWPATILFALGTSVASTASQTIWAHGPAVFWLCAALFLMTIPERPKAGMNFLAGIFLGMAVLTRSSTAFFAIGSGFAYLAARRWRGLAELTLGGMIPLGFLLWYNSHFFGEPILGGYAEQDWSEHTPLWLGVTGLLVSPSRGILIFSPALALVPHGLRRLFGTSAEPVKQARPLLLAWLGATVATLLFYARWTYWSGGWCFGPRFLCETMPTVCLFFACAYESLEWRASKVLAHALVGLSVLVQFIGLYGHNEEGFWFHRHSPANHQIFMFDVHDSQIEAYARNIYRKVTGEKRGG